MNKCSNISAMVKPLLGGCFLLLPTVLFGQDIPAMLGKVEYLSSCASCHGADGRGDGPVASQLTTPPANLQMISKNRGGVFPSADIYKIIDGRETIRAHGTSDMPVWGSAYSAAVKTMGGGGESGLQSQQVEAAINGRILSLIYYLESIQVK